MQKRAKYRERLVYSGVVQCVYRISIIGKEMFSISAPKWKYLILSAFSTYARLIPPLIWTLFFPLIRPLSLTFRAYTRVPAYPSTFPA